MGKQRIFLKYSVDMTLIRNRFVISLPSKITFPSSGVAKPPMIRNVVVLPQPEGPAGSQIHFFLCQCSDLTKSFFPSKDFTDAINSRCLFHPFFLLICFQISAHYPGAGGYSPPTHPIYFIGLKCRWCAHPDKFCRTATCIFNKMIPIRLK